MLPLHHDSSGGAGHESSPLWYTQRVRYDLSGGYRMSNILYLGGKIPLPTRPLDTGRSTSRPRIQTIFRQRPHHPDRGEVLLHHELPGKTNPATYALPLRTSQAQGHPWDRLREGAASGHRRFGATLHGDRRHIRGMRTTKDCQATHSPPQG